MRRRTHKPTPALTRRRLLAFTSSALTAPLLGLGSGTARAQTTSLDLRPARLGPREDDTVAPGYARDVLIRWGDRVTADAPPWTPRNPSLEAAETQFGWDGRVIGMSNPPAAADAVPRALIAVAHPTVDPAMAFPGGVDRPGVAAMMQGASFLNLELRGDRWVVVDGGYQSRRLTANTLCRLSGPVADRLGGAVRGLLAVSGGACTPWNTLLLTEDDPSGWLARLRGWDDRFADGRGFGWVVEIDPQDPTAVPVKRTALGRFAHGDCATTVTRDGRAVVYMSDRRPAGHLFRFTSAGSARLPDALDNGVLAAARLEGDRIHWLDLPGGPEAGLDLVGAAARLGAALFERPSGCSVDSRTGRLFLACRGNPAATEAGSSRSAHGTVFEITPAGTDHGAETAALRVLVAGGAPGRFSALNTTWPAHPDTVSTDHAGRAWIGTDRGGRVGPAPDMLFGCDVDGSGRGLPLPLYAAPRGAAVGGAASLADGSAMFVMVRTPGAEPGASWDRPGTRWPAFDATQPPRSALVTFSRLRGGPVGGA